MMENPIEMDDLGVPLFLETPIIWVVGTDIFLHLGIMEWGVVLGPLV